MLSLFAKVAAWAGLGGVLVWALSGPSTPTPTSKTDGGAGGGGGGSGGSGKLPASGKDMADCPMVSLPKPLPGMGTGFDAMPPEWKDMYENPMGIALEDLTDATQEAAALGAEAFALQAECAGYTDAAKALYGKADEIRSWS